MFSMILDTYVEGVLLNHIVALCLAFSGIGILVFLMFFFFFILHSHEQYTRMPISPHLYQYSLFSFYYSQSSGYEVVSHCDFVFPND